MTSWTYGERDLCALASIHADGIANNQSSADGNKRTAFAAAALFPGNNGLRLRARNREAADKTLALPAGTLGREGFAAWLRERTVTR